MQDAVGPELALEKHVRAVAVAPNPILAPAVRPATVKDVERPGLEVETGGGVLVVEWPRPELIRQQIRAHPGLDLRRDRAVDEELDLPRVDSRFARVNARKFRYGWLDHEGLRLGIECLQMIVQIAGSSSTESGGVRLAEPVCWSGDDPYRPPPRRARAGRRRGPGRAVRRARPGGLRRAGDGCRRPRARRRPCVDTAHRLPAPAACRGRRRSRRVQPGIRRRPRERAGPDPATDPERRVRLLRHRSPGARQRAVDRTIVPVGRRRTGRSRSVSTNCPSSAGTAPSRTRWRASRWPRG